MPLLGARALIDIAVPTGIDSGEVLKFQLQDGRTAEQIIAETAAIIGAVNEELIANYGGMLYMTESQYAFYRQGGAGTGKTQKKSEFKRADGERGSLIG